METARSFPHTESLCMLVAPDEEPPFPCTITMPFAVVTDTIGVVRVLLLGNSVTVLATLVKLSVPVVEVLVIEVPVVEVPVVEMPMTPPLIVPVQLVPAQQQATCPAQSYVQIPFDVQQTVAALRLEQGLQVSAALRSSRAES